LGIGGQHLLTTPDFESASRYILTRLERELSPSLTYHSLSHTRDDVLPAAVRLGRAAHLSDENLLLLKTAAAFHDCGFLIAYDNHEQHSIRLAREKLPDFGYSAAQIDVIAETIAATRLPQRPHTLLQQLICDADLDLLGRDDFIELNRRLHEELMRVSKTPPPSPQVWLTGQVRFLENHSFFTGPAREFRDAGKSRNLARIRASLNSLNGSGALAAS